MSRALLALLLLCFAAAAEVTVPPLTARVTDLTGTLNAEQKSALESRLQAFEREKGAQIAVLIVPTVKPESIEQYSLRVAEASKLGRKGVDDGALLVVAKDDRELRIEVGYGLEGVLPDAIANRIIEDVIVPRFRANDFYGGIDAGVAQMIGVISGEPLPEPRRESRSGGDPAASLAPAIVFAFVAGGILTRLFGRLGGGLLTAGGAGLIVWLIAASIVFALLVAIAVFVLSLFADRPPSRGYGRHGGWAPAGGWSSGSGGFGGGGFGGGGGGFGGGGASGRW